MPILERLDPELAVVVRQIPVLDLTDIPAARAALAELYAQINTGPASDAVAHTDHQAPGGQSQPDVMVRVFRPVGMEGALPCLYWIQGGGYVLTAPDMDDQFCEEITQRHQCVVVSVDWRRAPEHPFPAPAEDCYTALAWTIGNATELKIDPSRVVVGGHSSGGGSAAGLALNVRDRGEFTIAHQLLIYPMLDDTDTTPSSHLVTDPEVWNRTSNGIGWSSYLGETYGTDDVSPYAAPTRMQDLSGLAPTTVLTGELDLFVDEDVHTRSGSCKPGFPPSYTSTAPLITASTAWSPPPPSLNGSSPTGTPPYDKDSPPQRHRCRWPKGPSRGRGHSHPASAVTRTTATSGVPPVSGK